MRSYSSQAWSGRDGESEEEEEEASYLAACEEVDSSNAVEEGYEEGGVKDDSQVKLPGQVMLVSVIGIIHSADIWVPTWRKSVF